MTAVLEEEDPDENTVIKMILNWQEPQNKGGEGASIKKYIVEYSTNGGLNWLRPISPVEVRGTKATCNHPREHFDGELYDYRIIADNISSIGESSLGTGPPSEIAIKLPSPPRNLGAQVDGREVTLTWVVPENNGDVDISGYRIQESQDGEMTWTTVEGLDLITGYTVMIPDHILGEDYHYRVVAVTTPWSDEPWETRLGTPSGKVSVTIPRLPGAPTDLTAESITSGVRLIWTAPTDDGGASVTGYRIEWNVFFWGSWSGWIDRVANTGTTATTYDNNLGTLPAYYQVRAINSAGPGEHSNIVQFGIPLPGVPTGLEATGGVGTITLTWTVPSNASMADVGGYRIERSPNGSSGWSLVEEVTGGTVNRYVHTGLGRGQRVHYRVKAIGGAGESSWSNKADATTATVPGAPTGLHLPTGSSLVLSWRAPADGGSPITGYKIESSPNGVNWSDVVADTKSTSTSHPIPGPLSIGTCYRVSAINAVGEGPPSHILLITAQLLLSLAPVATVPGAPTNLQLITGVSPALSWRAPADDGGSAITGYKIESSPNGVIWSPVEDDTGNTNTTYPLAGPLVPLTCYRVRAINVVGAGPPSHIVTVPAQPSPPPSQSFSFWEPPRLEPSPPPTLSPRPWWQDWTEPTIPNHRPPGSTPPCYGINCPPSETTTFMSSFQQFQFGMSAPMPMPQRAEAASAPIVMEVSGPVRVDEGGTAAYTIALPSDTALSQGIEVSYRTDDGAGDASAAAGVHYEAVSGSLSFSGDSTASQTVTVRLPDNQRADGVRSFDFVVYAPNGDANAGLNIVGDTITTLIEDNDNAGIQVSNESLTTSEDGKRDVFTVQLESEPISEVVIDVTSLDTGEGTVRPKALTFTPGNWSQVQAVTATGVDDGMDDGAQHYTIELTVAPGAGRDYAGLDPVRIEAENQASASDTYSATLAAARTMMKGLSNAHANNTLSALAGRLDVSALTSRGGAYADIAGRALPLFGAAKDEDEAAQTDTRQFMTNMMDLFGVRLSGADALVEGLATPGDACIGAGADTGRSSRAPRRDVAGSGAASVGGMEDCRGASPSRERARFRSFTMQGLLADSSFQFTLPGNALVDESGAPTRGWTIWGRAAAHEFTTRPERSRSGSDEGMFSGYLGMDFRHGDKWLVGVATGSGTNSRSLSDRWAFDMWSVTPYAQWSPTRNLHVWVLGGLGYGHADLERRGKNRLGRRLRRA